MMFVSMGIIIVSLVMMLVAIQKDNKAGIITLMFVILAQLILIVGDTVL